MSYPHVHDDIELNFLLAGCMEYQMGGEKLMLSKGQLLAFWAAIPHASMEVVEARYLCVTIPLTVFLGWKLPAYFELLLLSGTPVVGESAGLQEAALRRWEDELGKPAHGHQASELEIQASLLRLAYDAADSAKPAPQASGLISTAVDQMRRCIAQRYQEPLAIADVARAAALHPNHAMRVYRTATGTTIGATILGYRTAHAKRLLATNDMAMPFVALHAGFGSERRMYEAFQTSVGQSPLSYRRSFGRTLSI
jgi:AraC family transcriptional regulator, melibiose operon regulatory protein